MAEKLTLIKLGEIVDLLEEYQNSKMSEGGPDWCVIQAAKWVAEADIERFDGESH